MSYRPKIGEIVKIRAWDDMVAEFGLRSDDSIPCKCTFTNEMKRYCGEEFTVTKTFNDRVYGLGCRLSDIC